MSPRVRQFTPTLLRATQVSSSHPVGGRSKLQPRDAAALSELPLPPPFGDIAIAVCQAGVLPRKELHECWEVGNLVHRAFPRCTRVADIAAGHGLLAWILVALAASGGAPTSTAVALDVRKPRSADRLAAAITERLPQLKGAVDYVEGSVDAIDASGTLLVGVHACGSLSDSVLRAAVEADSPVAVLPCCHSLRKQAEGLEALGPHLSMEELRNDALARGDAVAIDAFRARALAAHGYAVEEAMIDPRITPYNRLILGRPPTECTDAATKQPMTPNASLPLDPRMVRVVRGDGNRVRGARHAFQTATRIPLADQQAVAALAARPTTEWYRVIDVSCWIDEGGVVPDCDAMLSLLQSAVARDLHARNDRRLGGTTVDGQLDDAMPGGKLAALERSVDTAIRSKARPSPSEDGGQAAGGEAAVSAQLDVLNLSVCVQDRYTEPASGRRALTWRLEMRSTERPIEKADALRWRQHVRSALGVWKRRDGASFDMR
jgi:hypothetical protein